MNQEIQRIMSQLPTGDKDKLQEYLEEIRANAKVAAMAAIMIQGFSHGVGENINLKPRKERD
jgi:hypothetical protein